MKKRIWVLIITLILAVGLNPSAVLAGESNPKDIVIYFTNDVHGYITNVNKTNGISYAKIKALKQYETEKGNDVILVDAGDHISGSIYASVDCGASILNFMNDAGYDVAVPGTQEFNYGSDYFLNDVLENADFSYVASNYYNGSVTSFESLVLEPYKMIEAGGKKIAFVGVMTPETLSYNASGYFQDGDGNFTSYFSNTTQPDVNHTLYACFNAAIQSAKEAGADYVIGVGTLGDGTAAKYSGYDSATVIQNSKGLSAFIDGGSHTVHKGTGSDLITDLNGAQVPLLQAASGLDSTNETETSGMNRVGKITISSQGTLTFSILTENDLTSVTPDADLAAAEKKLISDTDTMFAEEICTNELTFAAGNKNIQRVKANDLADLITDSIYYYMNTTPDQDGKTCVCDAAIFNGGSIRASLGTGTITTKDCQSIVPFLNSFTLIEVTGQTILDLLEYAAKDNPERNGSFIHAGGLTYCIDNDIQSTVQIENGIWVGGPTGEYKVHTVKIYNKNSGKYESLDLNKTYNLACTNSLANSEDGFTMLQGAKKCGNYGTLPLTYGILSNYLKKFKTGQTLPSLTSANSPILSLAGYENYQINYESTDGANRIQLAKSLTVSGTEVYNKAYDGTANATVGTPGTLVGVEEGDDVSIDTTVAYFDTKDAGSGKTVIVQYTLKGESASKYAVADSTVTAYIAPASVIVTAQNASKVYGETDPELTAEVTGTIGTDKVQYTVTRTSGETAGTYIITPAGDTIQGNYSVQYASGTFTINSPKELTVSGTTADEKVYDGTTDATIGTLGTLVGVEEGHDVSIDTSVATFDTKDFGNGKTVTVQYTLKGADAGKYTVANSTTTADITRATVTVKAKDASKGYGETDPELTAEVTGTIGTDKVQYTLSRASGEDAGAYTITPVGNATQGNYTLQYVSGTFTVKPANNASAKVDTDALAKILKGYQEKNTGKKIAVEVQVSEQVSADDVARIQLKAGTKNLVSFDANLIVTVDGSTVADAGSKNTIPVSTTYKFDYTNKTELQVFRLHGDTVDELKETANNDGEYVQYDKTAGTITVVACKYSTYAFAYKDSVPLTGSANNAWLYILIAVFALGGLGAAVLARKKFGR